MDTQPTPNGERPRPKVGGSRANGDASTPELEAELAERYARVVALRRTGLTFAQVAAATGYADQSGAYRAWKAALAAIPRQQADEARREVLDRLDGMLRAVWPKVMNGSLSAVETVLSIERRRARLLGLDAPTQVQATLTSALDEEVNRLFDAMEALDPGRTAVVEANAADAEPNGHADGR